MEITRYLKYFSPPGKRYDLRSEEVSAVTKLTDDFRKDAGIALFISFLFPKFFKMIPKLIRDKMFGGATVEQLLSKMKSLVNVSMIQNIYYYLSIDISILLCI